MRYLTAIYYNNRVKTQTMGVGQTVNVSSPAIKLTGAVSGVKIQFSGRDTLIETGTSATVSNDVAVSVFVCKNSESAAIALEGQNQVALGRSSKSDVSISGGQVSGSHAVLKRSGGSWVIEDAGSRNGTYINGVRVTSKALTSGDTIFISGWVLSYRDGLLCFENTPGELVAAAKLQRRIPPRVSEPRRTPEVRPPVAAPYPYFQRSPRIVPEYDSPTIEVLSPPNVGSKPTISWLSVLLPPGLMVIIMFAVAAISGNMTSMLFTAPMSLITVIVSVVNYNSQTKKYRETGGLAEEKYGKYLSDREAEISAAEKQYFRALNDINPSVSECVNRAALRDRRIWERSVNDDDFLAVRLGTATVPSNVTVRLPQTQLEIEENPLLAKARQLSENHKVIREVPVTLPLLNSPVTGVYGGRASVLNTVCAITVQLSALHSYEDVKLVCVFPERERTQWQWLRWLPHVWDKDRAKRHLACGRRESGELLREIDDILRYRRRNRSERDGRNDTAPHYVVLIGDKVLAEQSGVSLLPEQGLGINVIYAYNSLDQLPGECNTLIECKSNNFKLNSKTFTADTISAEQADRYARVMAPLRFRGAVKGSTMPNFVSFLQGYGVGRVDELDLLGRWNRSRPFESLAAPLGIRENGEVFKFDIHERSMGPHGLVAGTSGWGKSETLTAWLLSLALNFKPAELSLVLIDFKGDGLGGSLLELPHVAGKISNISDISTIDRNLRSLNGELSRRQRLFAGTRIDGNPVDSIQKYQEGVRSGKLTEPLPYLIIVIDEFAEMKTQFPDKMDDFISVARTGRSLGVYLVLATQSPGGGIVSGQVASNTRFRICMKTADAGESKDVIGTNDAFQITNKGRAYVKVGSNEVYEQIQTFYSKASYDPSIGSKVGAGKLMITELDGTRTRPEQYERTVGAYVSSMTEVVAIAGYIKQTAERSGVKPATQVWTEALPERIALSTLIGGREAFAVGNWRERNAGLSVSVGFVDNPEQQSQYPLVLDFAESGHQVLYGAPQTGKTTFLQTAICSAALMYTPEQVQFAMFDFGNMGLKVFVQLPHTVFVSDSGDKDKLSQAEDWLLGEIRSRRGKFAAQAVGSIDAYREMSGDKLPCLLVIVDNAAALYNSAPDLLDSLLVIAREGGSLGVYLLMTAEGQGSYMYRFSNYIRGVMTLQLADKTEYRQLVGGSGKQEPGHFPGRGFAKDALEFQTALCVESRSEAERVKQLRELCAGMSAAWRGERAVMSAGAEAAAETSFEIGSIVDCNGTVIVGAKGSGKTNLLKQIAVSALSDGADAYVFGKKSEWNISGIKTCSNGPEFDALLSELADIYDERGGGDETAPKIVLLIDDFVSCYNEMAEESVDILDVIVRNGEDCGIYTLLSGDLQEMTRFYNLSVKPLVSCLEYGNAAALSGHLSEYELFLKLHDGENRKIPKYGGVLIRAGTTQAISISKTEVAKNA